LLQVLPWLLVVLAVGVCFVAYILYRELRNQHHMWHDPCVTPEATRDDIRYVLGAFREVFEGKGITWWLDYGTLLGAWRVGDAMLFDHDADVSYLAEHEPLLRQCLPELAARGIEIDLERTSIFYRGRKLGDAEKWWRHGSNLCRDDPARRTGVYRYWRPLVDDFPAAWIDPVWSIRFAGMLYPCPNHTDRFLRRRYLGCRVHLRLVIPHKQTCWTCADFWREVLRIWRFRDAPYIVKSTASTAATAE
jgi:hypothetical protein